ncbi:TetR/AcrR family transcriptional regulator [Nonomuraea soli]|uniref:AcrR family transcriptional regulator n=1 Tax=Nonomuraea soli TaxID=1032476 RepID=A0A7W0HRL6_9ACTN|nr:TetR/AcrR family transcriptional regulator [Nonomuraea soli]MBA2893124.1 AcrR family transcriptional regulator [Nonomuraea soli]
MRADARRNYDHLVATARAVFAEEGPQASLNEVARRAKVGPGTLYRHFPTRQALLVAVFRERIERLCALAEQSGSAPAGEALTGWLRALLVHAQTDGGLAAGMADDPGFDCHARLIGAATGLLDRAGQAGAVRDGVEVEDLFQLVTGIAMTAPKDRGERLLMLALEGVLADGPRRPGPSRA